MDEATAFLTTLEHTAADAPTACAGWTAHELVAHLAAGAAEMADLVDATVAGEPPRDTRDFVTREAPYVALVDDELRARLVTEALRLDTAIARLGSRAVAFSGRELDARALAVHGRSEAALHRWDLTGTDATSRELLAAPELTAHALDVLNTMLAGSAESVARRADALARGVERLAFAAPNEPDVVLLIDDAGARLVLDDPAPHPAATADAATRLLALWGRRGGERRSIAWGEGPAAVHLATFCFWAPNYNVGFPPDFGGPGCEA